MFNSSEEKRFKRKQNQLEWTNRFRATEWNYSFVEWKPVAIFKQVYVAA
jgi:hypothetical protein